MRLLGLALAGFGLVMLFTIGMDFGVQRRRRMSRAQITGFMTATTACLILIAWGVSFL